MLLEDRFFNPSQGGTSRLDLMDDVDAIAVVLDHLHDAAYLSLDPPQAFVYVGLSAH